MESVKDMHANETEKEKKAAEDSEGWQDLDLQIIGH